MQVLLSSGTPSVNLSELYAFREPQWVRANFVSTVDGSAIGPDHVTASINTPIDHTVFALQRTMADAVVIGAGTARIEKYGRVSPAADLEGVWGPTTLAIITGRGDIPQKVLDESPDGGPLIVLVGNAAPADAIKRLHDEIGEDQVWQFDEPLVDMVQAIERLQDAGLSKILVEGGPTIFTEMLEADVIDELALTVSPLLVGGKGFRIAHGAEVDLSAHPHLLIEEDGTLLGLWRVHRP